MSDFPFAMIGFDLDGTLVDSNRDLAPAINHALQLAGRETLPLDATSKLIGGGARMMLTRALELTGGMVSEAQLDSHYDDFFAHYEAHIADNTVPYDGCLQALDDLAALGCKLAVITNKSEALARALIGQLGMTDRFACILGGDTLGRERAKPAPDMIYEAMVRCQVAGRFAMIGDSSFDTGAARAAGVHSVVLSFGYNDMPPREMGAHAVIDHFDDLLPTLHKLVGHAKAG